MGLYQLSDKALSRLRETTFQSEGLFEWQHLQARLRDSIDIIGADLMVIAEEFGNWEDSTRRIDLLCIDRDARLVVVELKRTEDGGFMDLQAVRYAAMVSKMTFAAAVEGHRRYLHHRGESSEDAEAAILEFLGWREPQEDDFAVEIRLILVASDFSRELMTSVAWLSEHDVDITCIRLKPYRLAEAVLIDVAQVFPVPEPVDYQIRIREKERSQRRARQQNGRRTCFDLTIGERQFPSLSNTTLPHFCGLSVLRRG